jgi:integrase
LNWYGHGFDNLILPGQRALFFASITPIQDRYEYSGLILADAVEEGLRESNPATKRRGRGKRAGRSRNRGPEKTVTDALGILMVAERTALLSGRDDEFVAVVLAGYTGIRWGELVGLETRYVRPDHVRVEWQLYELETGRFHRCPPKDDSHRTIDLPPWLSDLLRDQHARTPHTPCPCHGHTYLFRSHAPANGAPRGQGPRLTDVARLAGVSTGTVSNVLNRPDTVAPATRHKVTTAIEELDFTAGRSTGQPAAHWRRSGFSTWLFQPAVTGRYPRRAGHTEHPVPLQADPWPGIPIRGRGASQRAQACWTPLAPGLTPHGLRHTHKTLMTELGTPAVLMDERMGHQDGSVQARYTHVTPDMRHRLLTGLTHHWHTALDQRRALSPDSPVTLLNTLLHAR